MRGDVGARHIALSGLSTVLSAGRCGGRFARGCGRWRRILRFVAVESDDPRVVVAEAVVTDPCMWSAEMPHLYDVDVEARRGERVVAEHHGKIGLRRMAPRRPVDFAPGTGVENRRRASTSAFPRRAWDRGDTMGEHRQVVTIARRGLHRWATRGSGGWPRGGRWCVGVGRWGRSWRRRWCGRAWDWCGLSTAIFWS